MLVVLALCAIRANAQSPNQLPTTSQATLSAQSPPNAQNKIRVQTNEVVAAVTVLNKHGDLVLDLGQSNFHVFDKGVEQTIDHWDLGGDPLAVALVIETSSHIQMMAPVIHGMGSIFTETVMALNGEAAATNSRANRAVGVTGCEIGLIAQEMLRKHRAKIGTNVTFPSAFRCSTLLLEGMP